MSISIGDSQRIPGRDVDSNTRLITDLLEGCTYGSSASVSNIAT